MLPPFLELGPGGAWTTFPIVPRGTGLPLSLPRHLMGVRIQGATLEGGKGSISVWSKGCGASWLLSLGLLPLTCFVPSSHLLQG